MTKNLKSAFTLAEVLITLGVIGVVAAVTMPTLIQNYKKHVVETRLAKFYTTINQAIQMSETVNGDKRYWTSTGGGFEKDDEGNLDYSKPQALAWFEKYLKPYLKYSEVKTFNNGNTQGEVFVYFDDGSLLQLSQYVWTFYPNRKNIKIYKNQDDLTKRSHSTGTDSFDFLFIPQYPSIAYHYNRGVEPYMAQWDGNRETLFNNTQFGCRTDATVDPAYCTKLIQMNGWKIPKDYPLKF